MVVAKWKRRSISAIWDFPPIPRRYNPYLSTKRKQEMHERLIQIADEYAKMEQEEIQLLMARST
jgi:predicted metal-dependent hydrolase